MSKRNLQPDELDRIGKTLISHDAISEAEIEKIVSSPFLYAAVRNRMMSEAIETRSGFGVARYLVFAGSSMAVIFSVFVTLAFFRSEPKQIVFVEQPKVVNITSSTKPDSIASASQPEPLPVDPLVDRVNVKRRVSQQAQSISYDRTGSRPADRKRIQLPPIQFYPVTYAGDVSDAAGGRIVRVELSRQALFTMGLNVPLENGLESVKADLLIGPDGVTRGIRLAKD
jgi:hypothetical protein